MSTQTRQPAGAPVGGQFSTSALDEANVTLVGPPTQLVSELTQLGFDTADSCVGEHGVATDPTQPREIRRAAARLALGKSTDEVIRNRWSAQDDGDGVTGLACGYAEDDDLLDEALATYEATDLEDGDEHLFGVDLAYHLYTAGQDRTVRYWAQQHAARPSPATVRVVRGDLDAYEAGSYKRAALARILGDKDEVHAA